MGNLSYLNQLLLLRIHLGEVSYHQSNRNLNHSNSSRNLKSASEEAGVSKKNLQNLLQVKMMAHKVELAVALQTLQSLLGVEVQTEIRKDHQTYLLLQATPINQSRAQTIRRKSKKIGTT